MTVPNSSVTYGKKKTGEDFLFLHLLEPHSNSEVYVDSVLRLLAEFGVKRYCLLGSMYDYVPHTKTLLVTGGGVGEKARRELKELGIESSDYQGPTSISFLISQQAPEIGMETMSLIVHLPQYTQMDEDYMGTVRLTEVLALLYNLPMDEAYIEKAEQQLEQINLALDKNPQLKTIVEQLESHYEARAKRRKEERMPQLSPEVEKFITDIERRFRES